MLVTLHQAGEFHIVPAGLDQIPLRRFPRAADLAWATAFQACDESADVYLAQKINHEPT